MPGPRRLTIALEIDDESLSGTVAGGGQPLVRIQNWLELLSAIEGRRPQKGEPAPPTERKSE